jgi:hypothetical protein
VVGDELAGMRGIAGLDLDGGVLDTKAALQLHGNAGEQSVAGMAVGDHEW